MKSLNQRKLRTVFIVIFLLSFSLMAFPQQKKKKRLPVKGSVTVKIDLPPIEIKNEAKQPWTKFESKEYDFSVTFPAENEDVLADNEAEVKLFQFSTELAIYSVYVREFPYLLDLSKADELYEDMIARGLSDGKSKILEKNLVHLGEVVGKKVIIQTPDVRNFAKFFAAGKRIYVVSVSARNKHYKPEFDQWAFKFLDSFDLLIQPKTKG
jgi:hypothetical protein